MLSVSMSLRYGNGRGSSPHTGHYLPQSSDLNYTLLENAAVDPSLTSLHLSDNNNNSSSSSSSSSVGVNVGVNVGVGGFHVDRQSYVQSPLKARYVQRLVAAEDKAIIFYRCSLFLFYFVSINERPAMRSQPILASRSEMVSIYKCPPIISGPFPKYGAQKYIKF